MMGAVRAWLTAVVTVTMLVSVAEMLIPEGSIRKIASFTGGLLLIAVLLQPVLKTDLGGLRLDMDDYADAIRERQTELNVSQSEALAAGIAERTATYISDKAAELGITVQVRVETEPGADGVPVPVRAEVDGPWSAELSADMAETLGIPRERQVWNGQEAES